MNDSPTILAMDASSTAIGYCLCRGARAILSGEWQLSGSDIADRCRQAYNRLWLILDRIDRPDVLAIESPVCRFAKAVIPQARVSGAILALASQRDLLVVEIAPAAAKRALTGRGDASKIAMQLAATTYGVSGEHASDALAVALASLKMVEVERV